MRVIEKVLLADMRLLSRKQDELVERARNCMKLKGEEADVCSRALRAEADVNRDRVEKLQQIRDRLGCGAEQGDSTRAEASVERR